ncbi:MAG TPA: hypothetical protein PK624_00580 [Spirochaetota bacterium]|nr:hypothetical protein [Spirochaetota bacterium]HOR43274.1 hypothetical protein [Spirochaetota bacterium]HPK54977.1 hypothetical protein [Spirochaetota bacterium]
MVIKTKKLITVLKRKIFNVTAVLCAAVFLAGLFFSLRTISVVSIFSSDADIFALYFFTFFFIVFILSFFTVLFFYRFNIKPGIIVVCLSAVPLLLPPDITAVIFDLFFSPRDGFLAYLGDKYDIEFLNNLLLWNYSVFIYSFSAYAWKMLGPLTVLIYFIMNQVPRKNKSIILQSVLFLQRAVSFTLVIFVAFIHQIPVIIKSFVIRYEYAYSFPDCFTPETFAFIYSVVFIIIAGMLFLQFLLSKRSSAK